MATAADTGGDARSAPVAVPPTPLREAPRADETPPADASPGAEEPQRAEQTQPSGGAEVARRPRGAKAVRELAFGTLREAWRDRVLGLGAEAAFWQLLSLPPLLLGILGLLGYVGDELGQSTVTKIEDAVIRAAGNVMVPDAVDSLVRPTLHSILTSGRADVVSLGFVISLWTGSSAMATYVNTITIAYGLRHHRTAVRSRMLALALYIAALVVSVITLPLAVVGPTRVVRVAPASIHSAVQTTVTLLYWPVVILLSIAMLTSLYHLAVPVRTPWRRAIPGALLAVALFLAGSAVLRWWLVDAFRGQSSIYGPLSATVAILLFLYVTALAILFGAELNAEIDRIWPLPQTADARRTEGTARPADLAPQPGGRVG